jgi:hypothetical protein
MLKQFDDHRTATPFAKGGLMRFKRGKSRIRCFAHILNLVVEEILDKIGSSTVGMQLLVLIEQQ